MMASANFDQSEIGTVTVTFNPDLMLLKAQLDALPVASLKLLVDNASDPPILQQIQALVAATPNAQLLRNDANLGLAAAVNRGVRRLHEAVPGTRFVLLLDQDSEPQSGSLVRMISEFKSLAACIETVACVGPTLQDTVTGLQHGFHQRTRWRWRRSYPLTGTEAPVQCANLNGSGTLVPIELFLRLGGLDESLFIDHVDTEWSFRVQTSGYSLWGIPQAVFLHTMGQKSARFWCFGWRLWPVRSPGRHYYLFRNAVLLMRRPYVPRVWKVWATAKLGITALVVALAGPARTQQLRSIWLGTSAGYREPGRRV